MFFRSDLALEQKETLKSLPKGAKCETETFAEGTITRLSVTDSASARVLHRPQGQYVTVEVPQFTDYIDAQNLCVPVIAAELRPFLPKSGLVLVAGLGNDEITPDAIGPKTVRKVLATRHLKGEMARVSGLNALRPVATVAPNVLGKTGMEASEVLFGICAQIKPSAVIVIDAFMARTLSRLGNTVQISDTGIVPGSGVGNPRPNISRVQLGVPVIAIGVPTVVDAATLIRDLAGEAVDIGENQLTVTPREIDLLVERAAKTVALAVNCALQPTLELSELLSLQA